VIVLDSAAAVDYLARLGPGDWVAEQILADPDLHAPHLIDVEVIGALRRLVSAGALVAARARRALEDLRDLDVVRYGHLPFLERMWQLRAHVTMSDAAFVALAEALGATLVTTDRKLAGAHGLRSTVLAP
jgi:predicted nucleic acid-binding protein